MKIHKRKDYIILAIGELSIKGYTYYCGFDNIRNRTQDHYHWAKVTCKNCLKHRPKGGKSKNDF